MFGLCYLLYFLPLAVLSGLFCPICLFSAVLSWLLGPGYPVMALLVIWLSCHVSPVLANLNWLSCHGGPVLAMMSRVLGPSYPVLADQVILGSVVIAGLSYCPCPVVSDYLSCPCI
jgi:hypothetical protein